MPRGNGLATDVYVGNDGCWPWLGSKTKKGYGRCDVDGQRTTAHRAMLIALRGPIPDDWDVDHLCFNPSCVRPSHLEAVTRQENLRRAKARITHCPQGHPYDEANTYQYQGARQCRTCRWRRNNWRTVAA